jgi:hypothetical protein
MPRASRPLCATAVALALVITSFARPAAPRAQDGPYPVAIRVFDEETGEWVVGAEVVVRDISPTNQTGRELYDAGVTNNFGTARVSINARGSFRIEVSKSGYVYKEGLRDGQPGAAARVFELPAAQGRTLVVVLVKGTPDDRFTARVRVEDGTSGEGVAGARVFVMNALAHSESYEAATDAGGLATFVIPKKGIGASYTVSVSGKGYQDALANFDSPRRGVPKVELPVTLERASDFHRARLVVTVTREGSASVVSGARVNVYPAGDQFATPVASGGTDEAGRAVLELKESGEYRVEAKHPAYTNYCNQKAVQLARYASGATEVFIRLIHPDNVPPGERPGCADLGEAEWTNRTIRVEVVDAETGARVPQADVKLLVADGRAYADRSTGGGELVTIEVGASDKAPAELLRKGFTLEVSKTTTRDGKRVAEYNPHTEAIPYVRLASLPSLGLTVRLTKSDEGKEAAEKAEKEKLWADIRAEIEKLQAEADAFYVKRVRLEWLPGQAQLASATVKTSADQASDEVSRFVRELQDGLKRITDECQRVAQERAQARAGAAEAERKLEEVRKQLDYAEKLASDCKDAYSAETAKNNYAEARQALLWVTRVLEEARGRNEMMQLAWETRMKVSVAYSGAYLEVLSGKLNTSEDEARQAMERLRQYAAEAGPLRAELEAAAPGLRARVLTKVEEWRKLPLPDLLAVRVNFLYSLTTSEVQLKPGDYRLDAMLPAAEAQLARFPAIAAEAKKLPRPDESCNDRAAFSLDEEVNRLEKVWLELGVEVGAAESWALKAEQCLTTLKGGESAAGDPKKEGDPKKGEGTGATAEGHKPPAGKDPAGGVEGPGASPKKEDEVPESVETVGPPAGGGTTPAGGRPAGATPGTAGSNSTHTSAPGSPSDDEPESV